jgi:hypothetical protein
MVELMNYATEMGSGAMIYKLNFITIGSDIQKLLQGIHIETQRHIKQTAM